MRAFLSTGANREFPGDPQIRCSAYSLGPMAVREARAILAETEPKAGYSCAYVQFEQEPTEALADALRAFVGEE